MIVGADAATVSEIAGLLPSVANVLLWVPNCDDEGSPQFDHNEASLLYEFKTFKHVVESEPNIVMSLVRQLIQSLARFCDLAYCVVNLSATFCAPRRRR